MASARPHSWRSENVKLNAEYMRLRKLVRIIAPEQFHPNAKPTNGPCDIVPISLQQYVEHKRAMASMAQEQMAKNIEWLKEQIKFPKSQKMKSAFGKDGHIFKDGRSPVLGVHTIWSLEHRYLNLDSAEWPERSEYQPTSGFAQPKPSRQGRYLPPPSVHIRNPQQSQQRKRIFLPVLPFDQTESFYYKPCYARPMNDEKDIGDEFEQQAIIWLGHDLMNELGVTSNKYARLCEFE